MGSRESFIDIKVEQRRQFAYFPTVGIFFRGLFDVFLEGRNFFGQIAQISEDDDFTRF